MKLRSRGLGSKELVMDFREYEITCEGDEVVVSGRIREPVNWNFSLRISQEDIPGMLRIGLNRATLRLGIRWALRRKPKGVVSDDGKGDGDGDGDGDGEDQPKESRRQRRLRARAEASASPPGVEQSPEPR